MLLIQAREGSSASKKTGMSAAFLKVIFAKRFGGPFADRNLE
jgi:hypothetical protein